MLLPEGQVVSGTADDDDDDEDDGDHPLSATSPQDAAARPAEPDSHASASEGRRQRRRLDDGVDRDVPNHRSHSSASSRSPQRQQPEDESTGDTDESGEDEMAIALGQLSLNEDEQVRFHGKMSGLHLLGVKERQDGRGEGGIWCVPVRVLLGHRWCVWAQAD